MVASTHSTIFVIPAKAGIRSVVRDARADWVPAFAGMTKEGVGL
jgi:hypothetical protein